MHDTLTRSFESAAVNPPTLSPPGDAADHGPSVLELKHGLTPVCEGGRVAFETPRAVPSWGVFIALLKVAEYEGERAYAKALLGQLVPFGMAECCDDDFIECDKLHLTAWTRKQRRKVTRFGLSIANDCATAVARANGWHLFRRELRPRSGAPFSVCTCGNFSKRVRKGTMPESALGNAEQQHLRFVGAK
jgi:hypothetical protein